MAGVPGLRPPCLTPSLQPRRRQSSKLSRCWHRSKLLTNSWHLNFPLYYCSDVDRFLRHHSPSTAETKRAHRCCCCYRQFPLPTKKAAVAEEEEGKPCCHRRSLRVVSDRYRSGCPFPELRIRNCHRIRTTRGRVSGCEASLHAAIWLVGWRTKPSFGRDKKCINGTQMQKGGPSRCNGVLVFFFIQWWC